MGLSYASLFIYMSTEFAMPTHTVPGHILLGPRYLDFLTIYLKDLCLLSLLAICTCFSAYHLGCGNYAGIILGI